MGAIYWTQNQRDLNHENGSYCSLSFFLFGASPVSSGMNMIPMQSSPMRLLVAELNELSLRERSSILMAFPAVLTVGWAHLDSSVPVRNLFGWIAYMTVVMLVRFKASQKDIDSDKAGVDLIHSRNFRVLLCGLYGAGWGGMLFLLDTGQLDFLFMFKMSALAAVLGITMNVMSVLLPAFIGFFAPLILSLTGYIFSGSAYLQGQARFTFFIGIVVYTVMLFTAARSLSKLTRISFKRGFERDAVLIEARESHQREIVLRERLAVLARHDDLTGAFNRRYLVQEIESHLHLLERHKAGFSIILFDLDHFKDVNDTFGHPVGDQVLIGLTKFVSSSLREIDIFGRWGGEEFLCILPNNLDEEAMACAERLRHGLENARLVSSHPELVVTASFGLVFCKDQQKVEDIMVRVDAALYEAKSGGRNRVIGADKRI